MIRVLVALDVPHEDDIPDLLTSVKARLEDEAGYLKDGRPVMPTSVVVGYVFDDQPLTDGSLRSIYEVGADL